MPVCDVDLRAGGGWHFVWRQSDGTEMEMRGVYREIAPPERLVSTESWGGDWPETINTLILSETDGRTSAPSPLSPFPEPGLPYVPVPPPSPGLSWWVRYATLPP